jgi:hypothetical protein
MNLYLGGDEVITGVDSYHRNEYEDRVWTFRICPMGPR